MAPEPIPRRLLAVPYGDRALTVSLEPFSPEQFYGTLEQREQHFVDASSGEPVRFRPATGLESLAALHAELKRGVAASPLLQREEQYVQLTTLVRTIHGVHLDLPMRDDGALETDEESLLSSRQTQYFPHDKAKYGNQTIDAFTQNQPGRALTKRTSFGEAHLREISEYLSKHAPWEYKVNVSSFYPSYHDPSLLTLRGAEKNARALTVVKHPGKILSLRGDTALLPREVDKDDLSIHRRLVIGVLDK